VSGSSTPPAAENASTPASRDPLATLGQPAERQELKLLLVAARHHLASSDLQQLRHLQPSLLLSRQPSLLPSQRPSPEWAICCWFFSSR